MNEEETAAKKSKRQNQKPKRALSKRNRNDDLEDFFDEICKPRRCRRIENNFANEKPNELSESEISNTDTVTEVRVTSTVNQNTSRLASEKNQYNAESENMIQPVEEIKHENPEDRDIIETREEIESKAKKLLFESVVSSLSCNACDNIPRGSIFQEVRISHLASCDLLDKILCESCLPKDPWERRRFSRNNILQSTLASFSITGCKFRNDGCKEILDLEKCGLHEDDCKFRKVPCPIEWCGNGENITYSFQDLRPHLKTFHTSRCFDTDHIHKKRGTTYIFEIKEDLKQCTLHFTYKNQLFMLHGIAHGSHIWSFQFWVQYFGGRL